MASPFPVALPESATRRISPSTPLMKATAQTAEKGIKITPNISSTPLAQRTDAEKNVLITSALPYVNNVPHLGNIIGSTLSADVYARYCRTRNRNTLYICGTDEYGTATETKALEEGVDPKTLCDKYHALHVQVYKWFEIGFDHFGRTTTAKQTEIAQDIFLKLNENGYLEERTTTQLFCEKDQRFLADRYVEGVCPKCGYDDARGDQCDKCGQTYDAIDLISPRCKTCSSLPIKRDSKHMFLRIDTLQPLTEAWARKESKEGGWSSNSITITESWFKEGLRPFSLTRDLKWGVPVPLEQMRGKVLYVWFDAPIGYPSITANYTPDWELWWKNPDQVALHQFMGKDNVRFHTVIFPSCLIGTKDSWTKLHQISTTEYLQYEGGKFSKSRNIGVFGDKASETGIPPSVWRYYLLQNRPETADSQFAWGEFINRNNGELLANLGNFVNRMLTFVSKKYGAMLPEVPTELQQVQAGGRYDTFVNDVNALLKAYVEYMEATKLRAGLTVVMQISARGNLFLSESGLDNNLFANRRAECDATVLLSVNLIYLLTALVHPFMPSTADEMLAQIDAPPRALPRPSEWSRSEAAGDTVTLDLLAGHRIGQPKHLFKKIDEKKEQEWREQFGGGAGASSSQEDAQVLSKSKAAKLAKQARKAAAAVSGGAGGDSSKVALSASSKKQGQQGKVEQTPEMEALSKKIEEQAKLVRSVKEDAKKADASDDVKAKVENEVQALLQLKTEYKELTEQVGKLVLEDGTSA
ncbi:methionyl-tRNA synthetase [Tilletiaria anomala UBC 951]|uniref:methionine--tRNA ligase n=1 Tax=Tilletiaria anomala (strain ATCC 24038 / CBS 436.72 / UBC 951) TaxID=1037660 RepID=A0A066WDY8_TILAU|nr:methionyl-tRNA synthetase [Tilletiaria anomala UBC 951]KDN51961.1 methionyl-tRNA synthetase [Tilletiaria anomala UBC 951]